MRLFLIALLSVACGDKAPVDTAPGADLDGDGYLDVDDGGDDCDDRDAAVHPGADELCDGVDNDCDGAVDEQDAVDAPTWYGDGDGDGYGDPGVTAVSCEAPEGYVAEGSDGVAFDCDDDDLDTFPGADEACDGVDNDCDGETDEDVADAPIWYADEDGDGFGDPGASEAACAAPSGFVADATDCDDTAPGIFPGADEYCGGVDHDCDGLVDEDASLDVETWYADADADGFGDAAVTATACAAPSGFVADDTDCDDAAASVFPGANELCDGTDQDCDGDIDEDALDAGTWYADADGDGYGDAAVTATACAAPSGFVADDTDCDDAAASVFPGADELCDGTDQDCDGDIDEDALDAGTWYADADGDGYGDSATTALACTAPTGFVADATDCDDTQASISPAADEHCDGQDDDCDGLTDEDDAMDAGTWYADADADGYGDALTTAMACTQPSGFVADDTDCDDAAADVYPGADEHCGGVDHDCDGLTDEDDSLDAATWYLDADGDGFGDAAVAVITCLLPSGHVADASDCDDAAADVFPGADEHCDGVDHDCDGLTDEVSSVDAGTWYADVDGDGYGDPAAVTAACAQPSGHVADDMDCDDTDAAIHPGAEEICNDGVDDDCDGAFEPCIMSLADADLALTGVAASENLGISVAAAGDVDGDGSQDLLIGANGAAAGRGAAYLLYGPLTDLGVDSAEALADARLLGGGGQYAGRRVGGGGDLDGDGVDDLLVSSAAASSGAGLVWVVTSAPSGDVDLSTSAILLSGESSWDYAGYVAYVAGDLNGDGNDDLVVDAYGADRPVAGAGAAYVMYGPLTAGSASLSSADAVVQGGTVNGKFGFAGARVGDVDGDGNDDLLTGAYAVSTNAGEVYLHLGPISGTTSVADADLALLGEAANDYAGVAVGQAEDFDGDGYADVLVGAPGQDGGANDAGAAYLVRGPGYSGSLASADLRIDGDEVGGNLGWSLAGYADLDEDGQPDLVVGANNAGPGSEGAMFVFLGPVSGAVSAADADAILEGENAGDSVGSVVAAVENLDGSGAWGLVIGANNADPAGSNAGVTYILHGLGL